MGTYPGRLQRRAGERIGVVLFDAERTRIFSVCGTRIEDAGEFIDQLATLRARGRGAKTTSAQRAASEAQQRESHLERTLALLAAMHSAHPFDRLFIAGHWRAWRSLLNCMPDSLRSRIAGSLPISCDAGESAILAATLAATTIIRLHRTTAHRAPAGRKDAEPDLVGAPAGPLPAAVLIGAH